MAVLSFQYCNRTLLGLVVVGASTILYKYIEYMALKLRAVPMDTSRENTGNHLEINRTIKSIYRHPVTYSNPSASSLNHTWDNATSLGSWSAIYSRSDRMSMPRQPVPGLGGDFKPQCRMDAPCITMGTGWFGDFKSWESVVSDFFAAGCSSRCQFVSDVSQADAVVFHGRDLPAKPPSWRRHPNQVWVYFNLESPRATQSLGLNVAAYSAYHTMFNWTATYQQRSIAHTPYGYVEARLQPVAPTLPDLKLKKRLAYIVFSNCWGTFNSRPQTVRRLQSVMELDVYGGCGSLKLPRGPSAFSELGKKYFFYLSFESAFCSEYITEKLFHNALTTDAAPVAIGGASRRDYEAAAPPNSFVYGTDFKTAKELGDHLRQLAANPRAYLALFAWRASFVMKSENLLCGTCKALHSFRLALSNSTGGSVTHLSDYFNVNKFCRPGSFTYLV